MGNTIKEQAALRMLRDSGHEIDQAERIIMDLREPGSPAWLPSVISQSLWGNMPAHESIMAARILGWLYEGGGYVRVDLGCGPGPDADVANNNEKLQRLGRMHLAGDPHDPVTFSGEFWGGNGDADGHIAWDARICMNVTEKQKPFWLSPGSCPLEVGYARAWQLWFHLVLTGFVARWPYGDTAITVLALRPEFWREQVAITFDP